MTDAIVHRALKESRSGRPTPSSEPNSATLTSSGAADDLDDEESKGWGWTPPPLPKSELEDLADACCAGSFSRTASSAVLPGPAGSHPYEQLAFPPVALMLLGSDVARIKYLADRRSTKRFSIPKEAA
jgi:hypothetical protein